MSTKRKKLRLDVEELTVESFEVDDGERERGTVHGREYEQTFTAARVYDCPCDTYMGTCYGTCQASCAATCGGPGCEGLEPTFYLTCQQGCYWKTGDPCEVAMDVLTGTL